MSFAWHLRQVKALLAEGEKSGELHVEGGTAEIRARCMQEAIVFPPSIVLAAGTHGAHALARDTVLRGAVARRRAKK